LEGKVLQKNYGDIKPNPIEKKKKNQPKWVIQSTNQITIQSKKFTHWVHNPTNPSMGSKP